MAGWIGLAGYFSQFSQGEYDDSYEMQKKDAGTFDLTRKLRKCAAFLECNIKRNLSYA